MTALRPFLPPDFVSDAARFILGAPGPGPHRDRLLRPAGRRARDGRPAGRRGARRARSAALGLDVGYVTDCFSRRVVEAVVGDAPVIEFPIAGHDESEAVREGSARRAAPVSGHRDRASGPARRRHLPQLPRRGFHGSSTPRPTTCSACAGLGRASAMAATKSAWAPVARRHESVDGACRHDPCVTRTDRLIIASCSNWGAYGLVGGAVAADGPATCCRASSRATNGSDGPSRPARWRA